MADIPQSRTEEILYATINGEEYTGLPESRIEELLLELKEVIESGGGGGGGTSNYNLLENLPLINSVTLKGDKSLADLGIIAEIKKAMDMITGYFDNTADYSAGDIVVYDKKLYKFTVDHTAGDWNSLEVSPTTVEELLSGKVDAVSGKGLSTNDYTDTDKAIVDGVTSALAGKADTSDLPGVATSSAVGLVKPDGTSITVDANGVLTAVGGGSGNTKLKTRYNVSYSSWSSAVNSDGYYTYSLTLSPTLDTTVSPDVLIAGSSNTSQPTDTHKTMFGYVERCYLSGSSLTLYAKTKPTSDFYIWVEGVAGSGSGSIVGNVIQPNGAVNPYQLSTTEAVFTGRYWTNGKRIMQRVFSFNAWASETHDNIIYIHSWDNTKFSSINYMGDYIRLINMTYKNDQYVYEVKESNLVNFNSIYVDTNTGNLVFQIHVPSLWLNKPITLFVEYSER